jgi:hypothetical protein
MGPIMPQLLVMRCVARGRGLRPSSVTRRVRTRLVYVAGSIDRQLEGELLSVADL